MSVVFLRKAVRAWRLYTQQRVSLRKTVDLVKDLHALQVKRQVYARLHAITRQAIALQADSRIAIVTKKLNRLVERWSKYATTRKAKRIEVRLVCRVHELAVCEKMMGRWKGVVDRNVRLKRIALGGTGGLSRGVERGGRAKKEAVIALWKTRRQLHGLEMSLTQSFLMTTQRSQSCLSPKNPLERAHFQYFEMQKRFNPPQDPSPAPSPDPSPSQSLTSLAISHYRDLKYRQNSLRNRENTGEKVGKRVIMKRWREWCEVKRAERAIGYEYEARLARKWLEEVGKYVRNVGRIMVEVGVFADINVERRIIRLWNGIICAKHAEIDNQRERKTIKRCFYLFKLYFKAKKATKLQKERAFSHYCHSLLIKSLYSLCKLQRLRHISKGFRTKSLFQSCFFAWQRQFQAHRTFQSLQIRPVFAPREQTAVWLWWSNCFNVKYEHRNQLLKALRLKWNKRGRNVMRNWSDFTKKSRILGAFVGGIRCAGERAGLNTLFEYALEVIKFQETSQKAFRSVRLKISFNLWRRGVSLRVRKHAFTRKRLFSRWRMEWKRQLTRFALYHRSVLLRKYWRKLSNLLAIRSKRIAAKAWSEGLAEHHIRSEKKLAVIQLLRNVFRRKAVRKLSLRAAKYYQKYVKRQLLDCWKCFHFRSKWKEQRLELANSFTEERLRNARYGPNEGKLVLRSVFTALKVLIHRDKTLDLVVSGRARRRNHKLLSKVYQAWKTGTKRAIHGEIRELALLGTLQSPREDRFRPLLDFTKSNEVKSEIREEIDRLERTIRATLAETANHAFNHL